MDRDSTLRPVQGAFRAITRVVAPAANGLDEAGWQRAAAIVEDALRDRPARMRRQLVLFIRVLGLLSRLRYGRRLEALGPGQARRFLEAFERAPVLLLRRGFWAVRSLAYMGYYGQRDVRTELGYRAHPSGWRARGEQQGPWVERRGGGGPEPDVLTAEGGGGATSGEGPSHA